MTATPVKWVLDELESVVSAQPADHPLWRIDRDNGTRYDGTGAFSQSGSTRRRTTELTNANLVGAGYAERTDEYVGTSPCLDLEEVVGVRIEGLHYTERGHVDPTGQDGVVFHGTDNSLVQQIVDTLYDNLQFPSAGRTPVAFTHLTIEHFPAVTDYNDHYDYRLDIGFDGFEEL